MTLNEFLNKVKTTPEVIDFNETISIIDANYDFTPTNFKNGDAFNEAGKNSGSCKLFSFAKLNQLSTDQTLHCFGNYYRNDVLKNPNATDHQNIRNFITYGWAGIDFAGDALKLK